MFFQSKMIFLTLSQRLTIHMMVGKFWRWCFRQEIPQKTSSLKHASHYQDGRRFTNNWVLKIYQRTPNTTCNSGRESGRCSIDPNHVECIIIKLQGPHSNHHHLRCTTKLWKIGKQIVLWGVQKNLTCKQIQL